MTTRIYLVLSFAFVAASGLPAQQGAVTGPASGFVFDSATHSLRPVLGIAGASTIGAPLHLGYDLASAAIAPGQDSAIVTTADGGLHIYTLVSGAHTQHTVDGLTNAPEQVVFSPSGKAAALYAAGQAQILTGLPGSPALANTLTLGGIPTALALSDDGTYLLAAMGSSIEVFGGGSSRKLMDVAAGAMAAFAPGNHDAAVVDPGGAGVVLYRDLAGASSQTVLAAPDEGTASPVGVAFSADESKLFLASASAQSVTAFDLASGGRTALACNCVPTGLVSMGRLLRLNELGTAPLWLFDAGADQPRIVFVPALTTRAAN